MAIRKIRNTWWVDFRFDRKRYRKRSPDNSRAGAQKYEILLRQKLANGETLDRDDEKEKEKNQSFKDFAWKWFDIYVKSNNKYSEVRGKKYILESHLVPFFGKSRISQITNLQIELYKAKKLDSGLSSKTVNNHLTVLAKCLRIAEEWLELEKLPKIKRLKVPPQKFDFLTFEESDLLLRHADGIWYEMILTALRTGLRFGELRALDWSDINWATKLLTVRHSLCRYRNIKQTPKSNKERHVPLADDVCEALGKRRAETGFVFGDGEGRPFDKKRLYRELKMICKKTGLRVIAWHALRHTFASHLAMAAAPMKAIQELMGHADITTTLRYAHLSSSTLKEVIDLLPTKKSMINFGQQAVNTYTNLTKIGQLGAYDKAIFLAKNKTKTAPGGHCSVLSG